MALPPIDAIAYFEDIRTFTFRNDAAITIPKSVRELAYTLQIDIKIVSIKREEFLSYRSNPANGQYGYAVLVYRDHCQIEVPISIPRQTLYFGTVPEAYVNRQALYDLNVIAQNLLAISNFQLVPIGQALNLSTEAVEISCLPNPTWIELPLREVYVKCFDGTQFDLEISFWKPAPLTIGNCQYDGKSGQVDGDKDNGLPLGGIAPNKAEDSNNPFDGLPSPSQAMDLGEFFNIKGSTLNNVDPDNLPVFLDANGNPLNFEGGQCTGNPNQGYWVAITRFFNDDLQQEFINSDPNPFGSAVAIPAGLQVIAIDTILSGSFGVWRIFRSDGQITILQPFGGSNTFQFAPTDYDVKVTLYDYSTNSVVPDNCGNYRPFE